ncbi:MAG: ABC transporter substrate-binding protein, partial [Gemmataceae bacterium]
SDPQKFSSYFVSRTAKKNTEYAKYMFDVKGSPSIQGDQATAQVAVRQDNGKDKGEVQWTFVKEGNTWKIKDAPLP